MFTSMEKKRLNPQSKPTLFKIPNPPPQIGKKRSAIERKEIQYVPSAKKSQHEEIANVTGIREEQLSKECNNKHGESFNIDEMEEENKTMEGNQVYDVPTNQSNENEEDNPPECSKRDFSGQTNQSLSNNTPRKRKQKTRIQTKKKNTKAEQKD
ncbi:uncharacterized protein LOC124448351 [Xenia sp. Carnegie-2017]|uniref:uncharacterized protein LOC124448351 n=1 Tax=Xenia sp. Carnegie-2017 TaxID=2897299 RepID=UPI001F039F4B|nr:uncharacterized protein LOC124448351 [Xenia sp. Carnegie-2017]